MIVGDLSSFDGEAHLYPNAVRRALRHVRERRLGEMAPGRYELEGEDMFALVQQVRTGPVHERRAEAHRMYADVQLVVLGCERFGYRRPLPDAAPAEDDGTGSDVFFYDSPVDESGFLLTPGMFAVFFPLEIHRPCVCEEQPGTVKKVVVKIHRRLLER